MFPQETDSDSEHDELFGCNSANFARTPEYLIKSLLNTLVKSPTAYFH